MLYNNYLKELKTCPFCEDEGRVFASNQNAYLTYAKAPYHPHHLLVIPKRHATSFFDIKTEESEDIDKLIEIGAKILKKLKYTNFSVLVREGDNSNKSIKHLHYHLIPDDRIGDLDHKGEPRRIMSKEEIKKLSKEIKSIISQIK